MAISATYLQLQRQIADELGDRQDLMAPLSDSNLALSPIKNAIQSAVSKWEREPFYFNAAYLSGEFSTVVKQEFYTAGDSPALGTMPGIDKIQVLVNANRYTLNPRTWDYIEDTSVNPVNTGMPSDWAYRAQILRFYPIPNGVYPVTLTCYQRFLALVNDGDSNAWTTDAYDLIRSEAKLILAQEVLNDPTITGAMTVAIYGNPGNPMQRGYLYALKAETARRSGRGRIRPTQF